MPGVEVKILRRVEKKTAEAAAGAEAKDADEEEKEDESSSSSSWGYEEVARAKDITKATEAEQGEICFRGRNIMAGYMANPALGEEHVALIAKKNADAVDSEGWLHSGDKG